MNDIEADDENSSIENNENILNLMDGIAISSQKPPKFNKCRKTLTVRHHKMNKAERNLMNNYRFLNSVNNSDLQPKKLRSLERWRGAFTKIKKLKDPWKNLDLNKIQAEKVKRYIFDSCSSQWKPPIECYVKMESKPFNRGAMRECYRLKKMTSLFQDDNWYRAGNYVAKRYIVPVDNSVYYEDVKLQMDAKLWGQEYSRQLEVIKKVDICQMSLIEFIERPERPLFHLEHFIEGDYIKYNSNSGFVDGNCRNTPQAFSHFTFERSGHKLIVVDIQGVGDLYTDPQIHTFTKTDYGDGNLGPRGMALFFNSHICNPICQMLQLTKFDLSKSERASRTRLYSQSNNDGTVACHSNAKMKSIFEKRGNINFGRILLHQLSNDYGTDVSTDDSSFENLNSQPTNEIIRDAEDGDDEESEAVTSEKLFGRIQQRSSECIQSEENHKQYFISRSMQHRASCVTSNLGVRHHSVSDECILGEIHHELARLHSCGKLVDDNDEKSIDWEAFMFHEETAAKLGFFEAICNLSRFHLGLEPYSLFDNYPSQLRVEDREKKLEYMNMAAEFGDRRSMIYLGDFYRFDPVAINWSEACKWYQCALDSADNKDKSGGFDSLNDIPLFEIEARIAEIKSIGGNSIEQDLQAAFEHYSNAATNATISFNGRSATKYFNLADEILSKLSEENVS